jgi:hypothetical protein
MEGVGDVEGRCGMVDERGEDRPVMGVGGAGLMGSREGGGGLEGELGKTGWGGGAWLGMGAERSNGSGEGLGSTVESSWVSGGDVEKGNMCSWKTTSREEIFFFCVVKS